MAAINDDAEELMSPAVKATAASTKDSSPTGETATLARHAVMDVYPAR